MSKFTKGQKCAVAALFGHSNMGQRLPKPEQIRTLFKHETDLENAVLHVSGDLLETDEHLKWFMAEARSWNKDKKLNCLDTIRPTWPDMAALIEQAMQEPVS